MQWIWGQKYIIHTLYRVCTAVLQDERAVLYSEVGQNRYSTLVVSNMVVCHDTALISSLLASLFAALD